jgi:hypothetical protein
MSLSYELMDSWSDVSLEKWAKLVSLKTSTTSEEAVETINILADIPHQVIKELSLNDVSAILNKVAEMQQTVNSEFVRIIKIEGVQYGFHPNLEEITLGEYADIETLVKGGLEDNLHLLMAILYRPIVDQENDKYSIEPYDGNITLRAEIMKNMSAVEVEHSMVFFWSLGKELLKILPLSLMELARKTMSETKAQHFQTSGVGSV